jgi:Protein of unknown function (DUF1168)
MEEDARKEEEDANWEAQEEARRRADEEKTRKNREKRNKKKAKKGRGEGKENGGAGGCEGDVMCDGQKLGSSKGTNGVKNGLQIPRRDESDEQEPTNDVGVAELVEETGIIIHDDD